MSNQKTIASILAVIILCLTVALNISAADGDVDSSFVSRLVGAGDVQAVLAQTDGKMLVGGTFTSFANRLQRGIGRLNADGSPDYSFNPNANGSIHAIALQGDKILIGGDFTQVGGQPRSRVARLNADGSLDATFQNPSVNNLVKAIVLQGNQILVGGLFDAVGGQPRNAMARLNANGSLDAAFTNPPFSAGPEVYAIALQNDKILIGGNFYLSAVNESYFGRLNSDGTLDNTFQGIIRGGRVYKIKIQDDKILVGGGFSSVGAGGGSVSRAGIARLNANGTLDFSFRNVTEISSATVYDFVVMPGGKIIIGGYFSYQNPTRSALARLESDGTFDATYDPNINGTQPTVYALAVQTGDGKVLVGGNFELVRGQTRHRFVRLNPDASLDLFPKDISLGWVGDGVGQGRSGQALAIQPNDNKILVGGAFGSAGGRTQRGLVRLNPDSSLDTSFNDPGFPLNFSYNIAAIVVQPADNKILVGGNFLTVNGQPRKYLVRLNTNGSVDESFNPNISAEVLSIAMSGNQIMIGGSFFEVGGQTRNRLARLNPDGTLDPNFNRGSDFAVSSSIVVLTDGKILAAGSAVGSPNGLYRYNINGTVDTSFTVSEVFGDINKLVLQNDKIIIAGGFSTVSGQSQVGVARLNSNGTFDPTFQNPNAGNSASPVYSVNSQTDGKVIIGGSFTTVGGQTRNRLARLNIDGTLDSTFNPNINNIVYSTILQPDGRILVGGDFTDVSNVTVGYVVRLLNGGEVNCNYSINPLTRTFTSGGGANNFTVTTDAGCTWTAASNAAWLTVTSGTPGSGSGTVNYTVAANPNTAPRTATITVSGQNQTVTHTVTQDGAAPTCTLTITPTTRTFAAAGGAGTLDILTPNGCTWNAVVNALLRVSPETVYNNPASITINDAPAGGGVGTASTYPSNITVSGATGNITAVKLTLNNLNHTYPDDVDILLIAPNGQRSIVMSDAGGNPDLANVTLTFDQSAAAHLPDETQISSGTFKPTNFEATDNFPAPAPGASNYAADFSVFNGADANGTWRLFVVDDVNIDSGSIAGGWSLDITTGGGTSSWIALSSPNSGVGNATLGYTVAAHTGANPRTGTITVNGQIHTVTQNGTTTQPAARPGFDFDGDGKTDISVFRPSSGIWYLLQSTNGFTGLQFGIPTDKIVPADYDGDGKTDVAVYRNGIWYLQRSQLGFTGIAFGTAEDIPVPADYDGDGKADLAVFRPSSGTWYLQRSQLGFTGIAFGQNGDKPVAADYDGDSKADIAVYRAGTWYILRSSLGFTGIAFGDANDKPVAADYDGDGKADVAVFRPSNGVWYLQRSQLGFTGVAFGAASDLPTPGDYDGDGKTDVAVFRPSNGAWYLNRSQAGFTGVPFGTSEDRPAPNAFVR